MTGILLGVLIGITTSLIAGILLIWRGEQTVEQLRKLPTKRRVRTFARAYILALRGYPYRYVHLMALTVIGLFAMVLPLCYLCMTYVAFSVDLAHPTAQSREALKALFAPASHFADHVFNPWIVLVLLIATTYVAARIVFVRIPHERLVPYAYQELLRLRECVGKCGTKKQFVAYTDAEHKVQTLAELRALIAQAKGVLGSDDLELANEILEGITDETSVRPLIVNSAISDSKSQNGRAEN